MQGPQSKPDTFPGIDPRSTNPKYTPYIYTGQHIEPPQFHCWVPGYIPLRLRSTQDSTSEKNNALRVENRAISSSRDASRGRPQDLSPPHRGRGSRFSRSPPQKSLPRRLETRRSSIATSPVTTQSIAVQATKANFYNNISRHSAPNSSYHRPNGSSTIKPSHTILPTKRPEGVQSSMKKNNIRIVTIGPIHYKPNNAFAGPNKQIIQWIEHNLLVRFETELSCPKYTEHNGWISVGVVPIGKDQEDREKAIKEAYDFVEYWKKKQMGYTKKEFNAKVAFQTWSGERNSFRFMAQHQLQGQKRKEPSGPDVRSAASQTPTTQHSADSARVHISKPAISSAATSQNSSPRSFALLPSPCRSKSIQCPIEIPKISAPLTSPCLATTMEHAIDTPKTGPPMLAGFPDIIQPKEVLPSTLLSNAPFQIPTTFPDINQSIRPAANNLKDIPLPTIEPVEVDVDKMINAERQAQMEKSEHFYRALAGKGASKKRTFDVFEARSTSPDDNLAPLAAGQVIYDRATKRRYFLDEYEQLIEQRLEEKVEKRIEERLEERVMARMEKRIELRLLTRLEIEGRLNPRKMEAIAGAKPNESALEMAEWKAIESLESIASEVEEYDPMPEAEEAKVS